MKKLLFAALIIIAYAACNNGEEHECQCAYTPAEVAKFEDDYAKGKMTQQYHDSVVAANPCCYVHH